MYSFLGLPIPIDSVANIISVIAGFLWIRTIFVITPQQHARVLETFGRYSGYRSAGLSLKLPWPLQKARGPFSLQTKQIALQLGVKSRDNAFVTMPISLQYRVIASAVKAAFYELHNPEGQIESYVATEARAVAATKTFDQLYTDRDEFTRTVRESLDEAMNGYGYEIRAVLIDDPRPTEEMISAFNEVLASQRRLEAAQNDGEAEKIKRTKSAEASAAAMTITARGIAESRSIIAEGNAKALAAFRADTTLTDSDAMAFMMEIKRLEALRDASTHGGRTVLVTGDGSGSNLGTKALLASLVKDVSDPKGLPATHSPRPQEPFGQDQGDKA
ncbi:regulator of protease activity HflC (stomatin/prohibitin superfamily) [Pseudaminobacter salicylatoxidans]|uniref:Regulator of protease activity HflC (Stomatin/prohibitin superfamily) n=1 Tax=Pseudaminobacter salicylatoxidans TaxID=93369 RepID=A0A316C327_PSESE|nr:SPFH domain-containing protein [Pseudaminobacter salicylatoxidans]PWJ82251.1 regulator of protease activity HflC (stomatin/prohibitin superfamily) [Pseudaminobacter salicylatoxidans]